MTAREQYAQVHSDWQRVMYDILLTDEQLYYRVEAVAHRLLGACFDFGLEEGKKQAEALSPPFVRKDESLGWKP